MQPAPQPEDAEAPATPSLPTALLFCLYLQAVHSVDTMAHTPGNQVLGFDWSFFKWNLANGLDLFKLAFWLALPLLMFRKRLDRSWFGPGRATRTDALALVGLAALGLVGMYVVTLDPALRATYPSLAGQPVAARVAFLGRGALWVFSWLLGWELCYRYLLLVTAEEAWPEYGWLLVPAMETLHHVRKPPLEMLGMLAFSLVLTPWARKRRSVLLPFLAHALIEVELLLFMVLV